MVAKRRASDRAPQPLRISRRQADRSARTRGILLAAARELFAQHGYADTSTNAIVAAAGVTRGALYHHFTDKAALFESVYRELQQELAADALEASQAAAPTVRDRISAGLHAYLDHALRPEVQRIALTDAPSVLGWRRWRAIDREHSLGLLTTGLEAAHGADNHADTAAIARTADILFSVLNEASLVIASAPAASAERVEVGHLVDRVLDSLL